MYKWLDNLDIWFETVPNEMFDKLLVSIQWTWNEMTLLSTLVLITLVSIICLIYLNLCDRKKYISRAFWRGYKEGKK